MEVKISEGPESIMIDEKEEYVRKIEKLEKQKQKVIALIKDGRFVEALQELEK